ncbi:unnamed protein product [Toxocara canis]|uniref:Orcokinin peptides type A n=1 Tax=Toxocara canis TaxID=6265 RepID=A0A183V746_TOXCA|nr:unnamed protein product [Toxocara canis]
MKAIATQLALISLFAFVNSQSILPHPNVRQLKTALVADDVGTKREFDRDFMHFGKRSNAFDRSFMNFGKRDSEFSRDFLNFGKRAANIRLLSDAYDDLRQKKDFDRDFMHFGKRADAFERNFMNFGKRGDAFSRDFLSFGKRYSLFEFDMIITRTVNLFWILYCGALRCLR